MCKYTVGYNELAFFKGLFKKKYIRAHVHLHADMVTALWPTFAVEIRPFAELDVPLVARCSSGM